MPAFIVHPKFCLEDLIVSYHFESMQPVVWDDQELILNNYIATVKVMVPAGPALVCGFYRYFQSRPNHRRVIDV